MFVAETHQLFLFYCFVHERYVKLTMQWMVLDAINILYMPQYKSNYKVSMSRTWILNFCQIFFWLRKIFTTLDSFRLFLFQKVHANKTTLFVILPPHTQMLELEIFIPLFAICLLINLNEIWKYNGLVASVLRFYSETLIAIFGKNAIVFSS